MSTQSEIRVNGVLYRALTRKCGKAGCRCNDNPAHRHGPYWYAFDGNGGGAKYVGAKLPDSVTNYARLMKASAAQIKKVKDAVTKRMQLHEVELERARRELSVLNALQRNDYAAPRVLESLGLGNLVVANGERQVSDE